MDTPSVPMKQCSRKEKCVNPLGSWLPATLEYFGVTKQVKSGLRPDCRACRNARQRVYDETHPDYAREYRAAHKTKRDKDAQREYTRKWRAANSEYHREYMRVWRASRKTERREYQCAWGAIHKEERREYERAWREEHREEHRDYIKVHRENNPDKYRAYAANRRARIVGAGGTHTAEDIGLQIKTQTDKKGRLHCWWCGKVIKAGYHVDHVIPIARGGSNAPENLVIAHPTCNMSKQDKMPAEFMGRLL